MSFTKPHPLLRNDVIEKFVVRVNPAGFGYITVRVFVMTTNVITKDDVVECIKQFGNPHHRVHYMGIRWLPLS